MKTMVRTLRNVGLALLVMFAFTMSACTTYNFPRNPVVHTTKGGLGVRVDATAPESGGTPALTGGIYTSATQVTPTESTNGEVIQSTWNETGADGSSVEIHDAYSTCSVNTSNVIAELGLGGGSVIHVSATGNGAPESCVALATGIANAQGE